MHLHGDPSLKGGGRGGRPRTRRLRKGPRKTRSSSKAGLADPPRAATDRQPRRLEGRWGEMEDAEATEDTERESLNGLTEKVIGAAMEVALRSPPRVVDGEEARRVTRVGRFTGEVDRFTREVDAPTFEVDPRG